MARTSWEIPALWPLSLRFFEIFSGFVIQGLSKATASSGLEGGEPQWPAVLHWRLCLEPRTPALTYNALKCSVLAIPRS